MTTHPSTTAIVATREIPLPKLVDRLEPLASALDGVSAVERINFVRGLGMGQLKAMWRLSEGNPLRADELVQGDGVTIGIGKNGLPLFSWFEKRFARVGGEIVGYNHNTPLIAWLTGPGHFTAYDGPDGAGEVWIDYRKVPTERHPEFPELASNDRWIWPKIVYGGMVDKVRRVSRTVVIGDSFLPRADGSMASKIVPFALVLPEPKVPALSADDRAR